MPEKGNSASDRIIAKLKKDGTFGVPNLSESLYYIIEEVSNREGGHEALENLKEILRGIEDIICYESSNKEPLREIHLDGLKALAVFTKGLGAHGPRPAPLKDAIQSFGKTILSEIEKEER